MAGQVNQVFLSDKLQETIGKDVNVLLRANKEVLDKYLACIGEMPPATVGLIYARYCNLFKSEVTNPNIVGLELFTKNPDFLTMDNVVKEVKGDIGISNRFKKIFDETPKVDYSNTESVYNSFSVNAKNSIQNQLNILNALAKSSSKPQTKVELTIEKASPDMFKAAISLAFVGTDFTIVPDSSTSSSSSSTSSTSSAPLSVGSSASLPNLPLVPSRTPSFTNNSSASTPVPASIRLANINPELNAKIPTLAATPSLQKLTSSKLPSGTPIFSAEVVKEVSKLQRGQTIILAPPALPATAAPEATTSPPTTPKEERIKQDEATNADSTEDSSEDDYDEVDAKDEKSESEESSRPKSQPESLSASMNTATSGNKTENQGAALTSSAILTASTTTTTTTTTTDTTTTMATAITVATTTENAGETKADIRLQEINVNNDNLEQLVEEVLAETDLGLTALAQSSTSIQTTAPAAPSATTATTAAAATTPTTATTTTAAAAVAGSSGATGTKSASSAKATTEDDSER